MCEGESVHARVSGCQRECVCVCVSVSVRACMCACV